MKRKRKIPGLVEMVKDESLGEEEERVREEKKVVEEDPSNPAIVEEER